MGTDYGDYGERLASVETEVRTLTSMLVRIESKLDATYANYVTKDLLAVELRSVYDKLERIDEESRLKKKSWPAWASTVIAAIALLYAWYHGK